jgi:hypothetical protein
MKLLFCLLFIPLFSCSKESGQSPAPTASFEVQTESSNSKKVILGPSDLLTCLVLTAGGSFSGHRHWQFIIGKRGGDAVNLNLRGDYPNDQIPTDRDTTYASRKNDRTSTFWALYQQGDSLTHIGSDSAFVNIRISAYDGKHISGTFSFKNFDPSLWTIVQNGHFENIPVTIK